ncbi:hypothetical protein CE91St14_15470 [Porphyromonas somerae]|nr:hypothetical protein CE91St14_15470 [Porphyromonas somerae]
MQLTDCLVASQLTVLYVVGYQGVLKGDFGALKPTLFYSTDDLSDGANWWKQELEYLGFTDA